MAKVNIIQKQKEYIESINDISKKTSQEFVNSIGFENFEDIQNNRAEIVKKYGVNNIIVKKFNYFSEFFSSLIEPFNLVLLAIGFVNLFLYIFTGYALEELVGFCLIFFMILLACITDFIQEIKAYKINISLHQLVENKYNGVRIKDENISIKNIKEILKTAYTTWEDKLTVGEIVYFSVGDIIPVDCKIIWSNNLFVNQSQLTGESEPVEKSNEYKKVSNYTDLKNILFSESLIVEGSCIAIIVKISQDSYTGIVSQYATEEDVKTDFDKGISKLTKIILLMIFLGFIVILLSSSLRTGSWTNGAVLAITIVVALTPEALPAIISGNLQLGSKVLRKHKIVVKKFNIIQNLGSLDVFTTDKTGTLTKNRIMLDSISSFNQNDSSYKYLFLNSFFQSSRTNHIDLAILDSEIVSKDIFNNYEIISEKQFDFKKRIVSVLIKNKKDGKIIQITKGSVSEVLEISSLINLSSGIQKLTDDKKNEILKQIDINSQNGKRSILFGIKILNGNEIEESDLTLEGIAFFNEEIKYNVAKAIENIYKKQIDFKILTGDTELSAVNVAKKINVLNLNSCDYSKKEKIDSNLVENHNVFAKMTPEQKGEVINQLHEDNHVVGYLGDGVNDVMALKLADVGISVNNGSSAAKQAADIILLEKDLDILNDAFILGRRIFSNSLKFIKLTVATNMGLMMTILITSIWLTYRSMIPIQLLIQNLFFDFSNLFFVFDNVDGKSIRKPMSWNTKTFIPYTMLIAIVSCLISLANILIMGYCFDGFNNIANHYQNSESRMQTIFFIESFITHMAIIFICRTERISIIQSNSSWKMIVGCLCLLTVMLVFVYIPGLNDLFDLNPPSGIWWVIMFGFILATWIILELLKKVYIKIFKSWI